MLKELIATAIIATGFGTALIFALLFLALTAPL